MPTSWQDISQTDDGRARALAGAGAEPAAKRRAVEARWGLVEPLKTLAIQGYKAPIGALAPLAAVFRAWPASGQMLDGPSLRAVSELLESTRKVNAFASQGFEGTRCTTLRKVKGSHPSPMPHLQQAINAAPSARRANLQRRRVGRADAHPPAEDLAAKAAHRRSADRQS